jgi:hypothetical protein
MSGFEPPEHLVILRTDHWVLNHRVDAALYHFNLTSTTSKVT